MSRRELFHDLSQRSGRSGRFSVGVAPIALTLVIGLVCLHPWRQAAADSLRDEATAAMKRAARDYRERWAVHGGYVYFYTLDGSQRWGEGLAAPQQVWVQPPGTPTVGLAFLRAYEATGDRYYRDAAREAAEALMYGQLRSGGWTNSIDLSGRDRGFRYSGGKRRADGNSSLDDGQTQSAIQLVIRVDRALGFQHESIHASATMALDALLAAQFPNGAFPQVWRAPVEALPVVPARYPDHDWRTEGRIKNYWDMYTLNDNVCGFVAETLIDAHQIYDDPRYLQALRKLGDFLVLAQMPDPQPAWAQQYNYEMEPIWARKFEPATIAGDESQETIATLIKIARVTGDKKYLQPIPKAIRYLRSSLLPDGRLARYYELHTNRPIYMSRKGKTYSLTYDDSNLPKHYGWKWESRLDELEQQYRDALADRPVVQPVVTARDVRAILDDLDNDGRWVSVYSGGRLVGQPKMPVGTRYLSSERFSRNLTTLSRYVQATK